MDELIGLIPAAGKGVRLGLPYPKELYPVIRDDHYKPIAQFVLENLVASGVRHVVVVINETKHQLIGYFGDGSRFGCNLTYVVQERREGEAESTSPGLSHALDAAYHVVRGRTVCFGMADTIMTPVDIFRIVLGGLESGVDAALGLFEVPRPEKVGMVRLDSEDQVLEIHDKPQATDLRYGWGLMTWRPAFTEHLHACLHERGVFDFADILNTGLRRGMRYRGVRVENGSYSDLGTFDEIMELERLHRAP